MMKEVQIHRIERPGDGVRIEISAQADRRVHGTLVPRIRAVHGIERDAHVAHRRPGHVVTGDFWRGGQAVKPDDELDVLACRDVERDIEIHTGTQVRFAVDRQRRVCDFIERRWERSG